MNKESMYEVMNSIDAFNKQLDALLDLMMCNVNADEQSIKTAAKMCLSLKDELIDNYKLIEKFVRDGLKDD